MFEVIIVNADLDDSEKVLFEGHSTSVLLPGEDGEFEILDFHKPIISRLKKGYIVVDNDREFLIRRGVAKMSQQRLVALVEV